MMNRHKIDTLTPGLLAGLTFDLMKGTCKSLVELEYFFEEVYKATTDQLDWHNPEGLQNPHDLRKPLPLIPNSRGRQVIPFDHFINNDLAYLSGSVSNRTYATSITKTKASDYGRKRQQFYGFAANKESARDVYSKRRRLQMASHQDIKDMLILLIQGKLKNSNVEDRLAFVVSLRMFTRSIVIQRRVKDLQDVYTTYSNPIGFIYQNKDKKNKLMCIYELHKVSDGTLDDVRTALNDRLKGVRMEYLPKTIWRQSDRERAKAMIQFDDTYTHVLERFNTSAGNPVKEILLKLNLPDHRSILTDSKITPTKHGRMTKPYSSPRFIANCFNARFLKMEVKVPDFI
ncbi:hypothetical protein Tco_0364591 [Tanacetum coccineum]